MSLNSENPPTGVKTQVKEGTSTLSPDATNESPFWTWRLCIQRVSNISISSGPTPNDSQISVERVWRSSVRTTRQPLPYLEIESEDFWTVLSLTPKLVKHWLTLSRSPSTSSTD